MDMQTANANLMQALKFTPDDLAANRKGQLTAAQQDRLKIMIAQGMRTGYTVAGFVILIVVAVAVYIVLGSQGIVPVPEELSGASSNAPLVIGVLAVVMVFYVIMLIVAMSRSRRMDSGNAKVKALTGKIKIKTQRMSGYSAASAVAQATGTPTMSYIVHVGREKIYTTDAGMARAFQDDINYRVYVIGNKPGYIIVSAEAAN